LSWNWCCWVTVGIISPGLLIKAEELANISSYQTL
jgi:hypothetical protein